MENRTNDDWIQAFETYLKRRFPQRSTAIHYTTDLRIFEQFHNGPLTEVTVQDVDRFVDHQYALGMALATVKRRVAALKTFFDFLAEVPAGWEGKDWMPEAPAWLREGCLNWIGHKWGRWKPSRRREHAKTRLKELRIFWRWRLAHRPLAGWDDLTAEDMAAFVSAQLSRGLKPKTVKDYLDTVYELLRYLAERGELAEVPRRPVLSLPELLPQHLNPQEVLALEQYVARREEEATPADWLDIALYSLLAHGGLRLSEVLDLEVRDLDLANGRVWVREGKGRRDRVVYLTRAAVRRLRRYLETVPHTAGDLALSWEGKPLSEGGIRLRIRRLGEAAGVKGLTPRRLRHTYATQLLNNGMSLEGLRQLMGHEDLNTTLIYARLADKTVEHQYRVAMSRITGEVETNLM